MYNTTNNSTSQDHLRVQNSQNPWMKIISINTNSIISDEKQIILQKFLDAHNPDILLLSETKLNPNRYVSFKNYKISRNDRHQALQGGGTAILYKQSLKTTRVTCKAIKKLKIIETTVHKIKLTNNNVLLIISLYATNENKSSFITELNSLFSALKLDHNNVYYIIAGDYNARHPSWGDQIHNPRGNYLHRWY